MTRRGSKSLTAWRPSQSSQLPVLVILLGLIIVITLLFTKNSSGDPAAFIKEKGNHAHLSKALESTAWANPTVEVINETEFIWQIPPNPKAVIFIAHGCDCTPRFFWPSCPSCVDCVGLPEEIRITHDFLFQKFVVISIKSSDSCWSVELDGSKVKDIITLWLEKNDIGKLPLVGLGASSGGYFLSVLATEIRFRGVILMIASGLFNVMDDIPTDYPPTLFVHMPKDVKRKRRIDRHIKMLKANGIEVEEIKCMEFSLTPDWLADRIPSLNKPTSVKLLNLFRDKGFVDANGYMKNDGRAISWKQAVDKSNLALPPALFHHVQEELNLAYAYHEMTSLQLDQIFEWLKLHIR